MNVEQLYAIVDIETTGGRPEFDRVMEVGVVITDGRKVIDTYETLPRLRDPTVYSGHDRYPTRNGGIRPGFR